MLILVDADLGLVAKKALAHVDGRGLPGVTGVLLEGEPEDGDLLAGHGVEHGRHHTVHKPALLVVVDLDHLLPVVGNLRQPVALTDVHEEAGSTETNTGVQELGPDPGVLAHDVGHLRHVGTSGLTEGGDGVHRGDPLRQECIGCEIHISHERLLILVSQKSPPFARVHQIPEIGVIFVIFLGAFGWNGFFVTW
jgi:hypothetical protein